VGHDGAAAAVARAGGVGLGLGPRLDVRGATPPLATTEAAAMAASVPSPPGSATPSRPMGSVGPSTRQKTRGAGESERSGAGQSRPNWRRLSLASSLATACSIARAVAGCPPIVST
jgi:hypothetical protein